MTVLRIQQGLVRGIELDDVVVWRGIPYAQPPVGKLRWLPPQPPLPWAGTRDADRFAARSVQLRQGSAFPLRPESAEATDDPTRVSEDCLYINVCAPKSGGRELKPVLFWIHGGGFHTTSGPAFVGDGSQFARDGIVVVTFNYRLGALGFLYLGQLLGPEYETSGTCGLQDQIAALRWVKDNIEAFGGDPSRVTIAGNSAGAKSVSSLLAAPSASGLFRRAISQSGGQHVADRTMASRLAHRFLHKAGLDRKNAASLLRLEADQILAAQVALGTGVQATWIWRPSVDGIVLPSEPLTALSGAVANGVDMIAGTNSNEAATYDILDRSAAEQAPRVIKDIFGPDAESFWIDYRSSRVGSEDRNIWRAAMGDERYVVPTIRLLDAQSKHASVWRYRFDCQGHLPADFKGGHGTEMPFVFKLAPEKLKPASRAMAQQMHMAWASFIQGAAPMAPGLPRWPLYDALERQTMIFDDVPRVESDPNRREREQWDNRALLESPWWTEAQLGGSS
ncbi:carboxylesterase family protein [Variovorax paradoxus]|uniref:carboxylesterase/lipase family protein n=1 Tax=Variovorax paradoxus TaxID=34073 RepID=UPI0003F7AFFC